MLSKNSNAWAGVPRGYLRHTGGGIFVTAGDMYVQVHVSGPLLCSVTNGHPAHSPCSRRRSRRGAPCSLASPDVHAATRPVRLAVVPVCVHGNSHAWYPCVPRGMFFLLVPASSPVASACTSYYVCPSRGPLRVARVCPPVMSAATRAHALPHYSLYSRTPPARRARGFLAIST